MKKPLIASLTLAAILASGAAMAQTATTTTTDPAVPGHPRVNEIDQRLENQQQRIDASVKDGQINAKQEAKDQAVDNKVSQQLSADEAKHNGHITKAEQVRMNKELNHNSKRIHRQRVKGTTATPASVPATTPAQ
jgi:Skp family chaperone for outer membrane proteins